MNQTDHFAALALPAAAPRGRVVLPKISKSVRLTLSRQVFRDLPRSINVYHWTKWLRSYRYPEELDRAVEWAKAYHARLERRATLRRLELEDRRRHSEWLNRDRSPYHERIPTNSTSRIPA